jgi:ribosomal protein L30/L7E
MAIDCNKIAACRRAAEIITRSVNPHAPLEHSLSQAKLEIRLGKYFCVRQVKSTIGLPKRMKDLVKALGFSKLWQTIHLPVTREYVGALTRARHLVEIGLVDELPPMLKPKQPGYSKIGSWIE